MRSYINYDDALKEANRLSNELIRPIEIVTRYNDNKFVVCKTGNDRQPHDHFIMLVVNFERPIEVYSKSSQNGEHWDRFATDELAEAYIKTIQHRSCISKRDLRCPKTK